MESEPARKHRGLVLVVDDDPDAQFIYPVALEHAGYDVRLAINGVEALEAIAGEPPDVVVLDFAMPKLSGPDVFARLRANPETRKIPVIACTALAIPADVPELRSQGYADVLLKPVEPAMLVAAVDRACLRSIDARHGSR